MFDPVESGEDIFFGEALKPFLKRVPTRIDRVRGIQTFGLDNLYPQRALEVFKQSYTLKAAVKRYADFTIGQGFVDETLNNIIINADGLGGTKLLAGIKPAIWDFAFGDTIALHFNYNMLFRISSINVLREEYCRLGEPDENGNVITIKYSTNWEGNRDRVGRKRVKVDTYPVFDPDPLVVQEQIDQAGGIHQYEGQILYLTPRKDEYTETTFDAVLDHAQVQGDSGEFSVGITQNAFLGNVACVYPSEFESEEEKKKFLKFLDTKQGARNAGKIIGIQDKSGTRKASEMFVNLGLPNSDKMFEYTDKNVKNAIRENYSMPMEILGVAPETGMFNQSNIREAYNYYNSITLPRRLYITELLKQIFCYWKDPIAADFTIKPLKYTSDEMDKDTSYVTTAILALQKSVSQGYTTKDSAIQILVVIFSLSADVAMELIGDPVPTAPDTPAAAAAPGAPAAPAPGSPPAPANLGAPGAAPKAAAPVINEVLTNMSGRQKINFQRIIRDFMNGKTTKPTAKILLQAGFGLTSEQIDEILVEEEAVI